MREAISETGIYRAEFRIKRADNNKIRWMRGFGRVVEKRDAKSSRMIGVMYDITESKMLEQQKDEFIGIASHELKTPVTSISVFGEVLQQRFEQANDRESTELMRKMNSQIDRLARLISDLLDTTRIAEGTLVFKPEHVDLNQMIREKIEEVRHLTQNHTFHLQLLGQLPAVVIDQERIGQVMTNLLSNAIKYSPAGGEIVIRTQRNGSKIKVSIRDQGLGIPPTSQGRIFDRFFRINNPATHTFSGMGLGLYISAGIIHRHGGSIGVESEEGEGSLFWFTLPCDGDHA